MFQKHHYLASSQCGVVVVETIKQLEIMINENKIIGDLQERNAMLQKCLEEMLEAKSLEEAKKKADDCLGALAVVENITPRTPMWIGVEIPTGFGFYRLCLGINQEDGNDISFCNEADVEHGEREGYNPWNCDGDIVVSYGTEGNVFDENHELIKD